MPISLSKSPMQTTFAIYWSYDQHRVGVTSEVTNSLKSQPYGAIEIRILLLFYKNNISGSKNGVVGVT